MKSLKIGILHSIIGKNDGVSIVIDQTVEAMRDYMDIPIGNIFFLAAHAPARFQVETNEVFWHKSDVNQMVVSRFSGRMPKHYTDTIESEILYAENRIREFIDIHKIDILFTHNTSHIYNFVTAVALGRYMEKEQQQGNKVPKVILWWHDSYFEREEFANPGKQVKKYLQHIPGTYLDGIVFINSEQPAIAKKYFEYCGYENIEEYFANKTSVIPNTCSIDWNWKDANWEGQNRVVPPQARFNRSFFKDIGLIKKLKKLNMTIDDAVILLQHTRIVPRKKIEIAIDLAFSLDKKFRKAHQKKCIVLLISGHSGDEQNCYKKFLKSYFKEKRTKHPKASVILLFGEKHILPAREIVVDKKYYQFYDIPSIVTEHGGIGTYFSDVEGFGNNLLEMISFGLPVIVNKYDIYKTEIEPLGFKLPAIDELHLTTEAVDQVYELLCDNKPYNNMVKHNLTVLEKNLNHKVIADKLTPLVQQCMDR